MRQLLARPGSRTRSCGRRRTLRVTGVERGTAPFAEGGFPTPSGRARIVDPRARAPRRRPAGRLHAAGRGGRRGARRALPAGARGARRPLLHELDVRLACPGTSASRGPPLRPPAPRRRGGARPGRRQPRCGCTTTAGRSWRPWRSTTRPGPGLGVHLQGLLGAVEPRRQNVNAVTAVRDTDLGGGPTFHDTRVRGRGRAGRAAGDDAARGRAAGRGRLTGLAARRPTPPAPARPRRRPCGRRRGPPRAGSAAS